MTINEYITNYKTCYMTQIDYLYISGLSYYVFGSSDAPQIVAIKSDISVINQYASQLFNCFNQTSYDDQAAWKEKYGVLTMACNTTKNDAATIIGIIQDQENPDSHAPDLIAVLNILTADCDKIIKNIMVNRATIFEKKKGREATATVARDMG
jgi:hypothetical protein